MAGGDFCGRPPGAAGNSDMGDGIWVMGAGCFALRAGFAAVLARLGAARFFEEERPALDFDLRITRYPYPISRIP
jgi:hypothetical protein